MVQFFFNFFDFKTQKKNCPNFFRKHPKSSRNDSWPLPSLLTPLKALNWVICKSTFFHLFLKIATWPKKKKIGHNSKSPRTLTPLQAQITSFLVKNTKRKKLAGGRGSTTVAPLCAFTKKNLPLFWHSEWCSYNLRSSKNASDGFPTTNQELGFSLLIHRICSGRRSQVPGGAKGWKSYLLVGGSENPNSLFFEVFTW